MARMHGLFFGILLFISSASYAETDAYGDSFYQLANQTITSVNQKLQQCGLEFSDPYDSRLPYPQTSAISAIHTSDFRLLAYYNEELDGVNRFVYKNWNGALPHFIEFNQKMIQFVTPYLGVVGRITRFKTTGGYGYNFFCRGYMTDESTMYDCINHEFVNVITQQLCNH